MWPHSTSINISYVPNYTPYSFTRNVISTPSPASPASDEEAAAAARQMQQQQGQEQQWQHQGLQSLLRLRGVGFPLGNAAAQQPLRERIGSYEEFHEAYENLKRQKARRILSRLSVVGETGEEHHKRGHPVAHLLHERIRSGSKPGQRSDGAKVGLAIEGGGMRGAVSAGAAAALNLLGLSDAFDAVYGSSAGALIAAFFISRQLNGTVIYSDVIPRAGKRFLDRSQLLPAMGLLPTLGKGGKPVLNLEFLLDDVVRNTVPLDWCVLRVGWCGYIGWFTT